MNHSCGDSQFCHFCSMLDDRCHEVYTSALVSGRGCAHMLVTASVIYMYFDQFTVMRFCCLTGQYNFVCYFGYIKNGLKLWLESVEMGISSFVCSFGYNTAFNLTC